MTKAESTQTTEGEAQPNPTYKAISSAYNTAARMVGDVETAIVPIFICGCFFSGIFGFVYLMLLKNCARAMVWLTGV
jgi:hypothetical protein